AVIDRESINRALWRATGYQLTKTDPADGSRPPRRRRSRKPLTGRRLVEKPTFILCSLRSGSTLLRVLLNSHSQIHSPHELHLRHIKVDLDAAYAEKALGEIGLDAQRLRFLLWDRLLHRELTASGKRLLVNKTPNDVFIADEIRACWPDARFIFLLRHPAATARSRQAARKDKDTEERNLEMVLRYATALEAARQRYDGLTVRYEDLTQEPERVTREVCAFLRVPWERRMLDYGDQDHGRFRPGLGDWSEKIKSGQIHPPEPLPSPDEIPPQLREISEAWGYVPARA
ncbi:MAG TPA: sulfotransferase, partial [Solirubrobacteraceae bacterium]|nr:sulfotransferase [Solirubrobacteraceae bacterium]